ncbi:MAG: transglycosylase domain-containing protein, partial [Alphaproteobacteria bacterium]|nr:transglycosylase domain-containing protein [Alphaproteobacteria bacterium]
DRNFYHHFGANPVSIVRALIVNANEGSVRQGGSTITQQLAKNVFLSSDRTMKRKIQELMLAFWLERKFSKNEILTLYLNRVYFGAGAYGVDAASYRYFGKSAHYLSVGEAAVLAGLLKAPSRYAPTSNPEDSGKRGRLVIEQMVTAGFLSRAEADAAIAEPVLLAAPRFEAAP